jgi:hypothetical protein|tara:strand:- start:1708 stop:1899 length:192 start_codon:yes stop_codon:yes gene_type:complete
LPLAQNFTKSLIEDIMRLIWVKDNDKIKLNIDNKIVVLSEDQIIKLGKDLIKIGEESKKFQNE